MAFLCTCFNTKMKLSRRRKHNLQRAQQHYDYDDDDDDDDDVVVVGDNEGVRLLLGRLSWDQIRRCTSDFSSLIGSGGFSNVYLAHFPCLALRDVVSAVKVHCRSTDRLSGIYKQELEILLGLRHDRIVKLLGYTHDTEEGVLVFEYVPNGNLQDKLHGGGRGGDLLSWRSRVKIAFQLAQALEYLHHHCPLQIIHGDIKASNILLDQHLDCKLCDFGSAKMGFTSAVLPPQSSSSNHHRRMMMLGSPGYTDPHYLWTGIISKKNDIYSFGVVLLELITGLEALNPDSGQRLTSVAAPMLRDPSSSKVAAQMADARLFQEDDKGRGFDLEQVKAMAAIAAMCLSETPSLRPSASDIVNLMRNSNLQTDSPFSLSKG